MAITEGETVYWNLETNTPFYGWGTAGRIETTALVLQLLIKRPKTQNPKTENSDFQRHNVFAEKQRPIRRLVFDADDDQCSGRFSGKSVKR